MLASLPHANESTVLPSLLTALKSPISLIKSSHWYLRPAGPFARLPWTAIFRFAKSHGRLTANRLPFSPICQETFPRLKFLRRRRMVVLRKACRTQRIRSEPALLSRWIETRAALYRRYARVAGPLQPMTPLAGVIDEKIYEQRIAVLDLGHDHLTQVTPADVYVYEYGWTPDGQGWAATAAHGSGDANWWVARLYTVNVQTGEMREIYKPKLQIADPQVSPDGRNVAFIEGLMSDEGSTGGDIYVVPIAGGAARNLTPSIKASPNQLAWTAADRITFSENIDGNSGFGSITVQSGAIQQLWSGEESASPVRREWVSRTSNDDQAITAIVRQSPGAPPEVWAGPIGDWKQLTDINASAKPIWGKMRNVHWTNGPAQVQGWLLMPRDFSSSKTYPLVVERCMEDRLPHAPHTGTSAAWDLRPPWDILSSAPIRAAATERARPSRKAT